MPRWALFTVDLWARCRAKGGGLLGGVPPTMPCAGGYGEQPAALMDAFDMLEEMARDARDAAH
ncbi:MAG: hypothetical protein U9R64_12230 [Pseudomonadota bacterium]|nr:hypothetical protein [Pseudomonadota bacterium]